jgi:hypothetical protein
VNAHLSPDRRALFCNASILMRCAILALLLSGCATQGHLEPTSGKLKHEGSAVVLLMTPDVQLSEITTAGLSEPNAEWTGTPQWFPTSRPLAMRLAHTTTSRL